MLRAPPCCFLLVLAQSAEIRLEVEWLSWDQEAFMSLHESHMLRMADQKGKRSLGHWQRWWALCSNCLNPPSGLSLIPTAETVDSQCPSAVSPCWELPSAKNRHPTPDHVPFLVRSLHPMTGWWEGRKACPLSSAQSFPCDRPCWDYTTAQLLSLV